MHVICVKIQKGSMYMRLITRSDFDGLACGALLKEAGVIDSWKFAHPKDLQDGLIEVDENDDPPKINLKFSIFEKSTFFK